MTTPYSPPYGFTDSPALDIRPESDIIFSLTSYQPVTSDQNVWAFWDSGWQNIKPWCKRNIINWVRRLGPEWTVRVLDNVPGSDNNLSQYVPTSSLPPALNEGNFSGPPQHISDLIRLPLLYIHGGVWMDAGTILLRHLNDICWRAISDPANLFEMAAILMPLRKEAGTILNGFIATKRGNGMVKRWHDVYSKLWEGKTSSEGFSKNPILAHLSPLQVQLETLNCPLLLMPNEALGDYLAHFLAFDRLRCLVDPSDGFDGAEYFTNKMFLIRAEEHLYYAQRITGWDGRHQYNMLTTKVSPEAKGYAEAKDFVDSILRHSVMMKMSHGPPCGLENLASIWDQEEHSEDDIVPGTFGSYLRHGSVHWDVEQAAVSPTYLPKPARVFSAGVLEPIIT